MKHLFHWLLFLAMTALLCGCGSDSDSQDIPTIKVGHVGHDHHVALFVALDKAEEFSRQTGISLRTIEDRKLYELTENGQKIADVQIVRVGGGSKMPTALAQRVIDVGLGGVAAVLASADSGAPVKLISPLHHKGDMFVVNPDFPARTWQEFIQIAKTTDAPLRIGYKNPVAVAKIIFEEALKHEGITCGGDLSQENLQVHMINVKGGGKLNVSLQQGLLDGYVGNNPFPAIGAEKGMLRVVCDLEELPPGTFRNHPCCCIGANSQALAEHPEAITKLLILLLQATDTINNDLDCAVQSACRWIGTSKAVEQMSIPTSGYTMDDTPQWHNYMAVWIKAMNGLGVFNGKLKGLDERQVQAVAFDLSLLYKAKETLAQRRAEN